MELKSSGTFCGWPIISAKVNDGDILFDVVNGFFYEKGKNIPLVECELNPSMRSTIGTWKRLVKDEGIFSTGSTQKKDDVNHPEHYNQGEIEVLEYLTDKFGIAYVLGTLSKYAPRVGKKDDALKDVSKIVFYAIWAQEVLLAEKENRKRCRPNELMQKFKERT